jgi:type IV pilus assembly protein PilC
MFVIIAILILFLYTILGYKKPGIALVTSPFVCFFLVCAAFLQERPEIALFAPLIFFATLAAVLMAGREADFERWPQRWAKCILITSGLLLLFVIAFELFWSAGSVGVGLFILFIGAIISYGLTSRHAIAAYVISTIGSSMRQNLPLPMALESAAGGRGDSRSKILRRIKKWLVQGYSLSESIRQGYPKCPGYAVAMIAAAERIDQLPLAIKSIEADMVARADESRKIRPVHPLYPVIIIGFTFFMVLAVMTFVIPRFSDVLEEMVSGAQLPVATRFLMHIVGFVANGMGPVLWGILAFIVLVVVPVSIRIKFRPRRPQKPYLLSRVADFIKWHLPVLHWFEKNYSMVQVVEILRLSLNAGCTVNDAIANTLGLDVNNRFRKRLQGWLARVERGDNIASAARKSRLGNSLAWAFDEKVNQGNTLAILETLESFHRSNYSYRVNLARFIMWPCVTIIMGAMVGFVVYAIFSPGIVIIKHLASSVTP